MREAGCECIRGRVKRRQRSLKLDSDNVLNQSYYSPETLFRVLHYGIQSIQACVIHLDLKSSIHCETKV